MTLLIDGLPPTADDLTYFATTNYGAYTSFRVEAGGVRGLDLHLARLDASAKALFGDTVPEDDLSRFMCAALGDRTDAWLRVGLFSPDIWARTPDGVVRPRVLTTVSPPPPPLANHLRLQTQTHTRLLPEHKHTATIEAIHARRMARQAGFDDAFYVDRDGLISEGSLWNIGFLAGDTVVWPQAPMLAGVAQALIQQGLAGQGMSSETRPIRVDDLTAFDGAFICNSATPACAVTAIEDVAFQVDEARLNRLRAAWASVPLQPI
ncbi:class IV aminotransferase [Brevundimonas sp. AAP58]|uniref:aminotransferase class IV n=1 Tax=Brevundimonas sp. AAP58 TaxID=1523422 RepID=UPI0006B9432B|nr:aminotransferase class IV [Brevundimonas sp. AAP58]KPF77553.1 class IV aminotransferase [Brevundimonas sp. AAP58]